MKTLDFAAADVRTMDAIISCFNTKAAWVVNSVVAKVWSGAGPASGEQPRQLRWEIGEDGSARVSCRDGLAVEVWMQGRTILARVELSGVRDPQLRAIVGLAGVLKKVRGARTLPVKVDRGDTVTLKAALAVVAMAHAQDNETGLEGVIMDMARDGLI